jgi:hypothetical protein
MKAPTKTHVLICMACKYISDPLTPERGEVLKLRLEASPGTHDMHVLPRNIGYAIERSWLCDHNEHDYDPF